MDETPVCEICGLEYEAEREVDFAGRVCAWSAQCDCEMLADAYCRDESPFFADVRALVAIARRVADGETSDDDLAKLSDAVDDVLRWEETDDPRANGWVDDRGRP